MTRFNPGIPGHGERRNLDVVGQYPDALFALPAAEGGRGDYSLFIKGVDSLAQVKLSVSGFYAPSRNAIIRTWKPAWLKSGPIPQHPDGFPMAEFIDCPKE